MNYNCDVLVAGGGIAGVSAALSAAREGKKVMLLEKSYMLGGLATAGLIAIYLPICDGKGRQVSFGIAEELLRLSAALCPKKTKGYTHWIENGGKNSDENSPRFEVDFNPQIAALLYERILLENKVEILVRKCHLIINILDFGLLVDDRSDGSIDTFPGHFLKLCRSAVHGTVSKCHGYG